MSGILEDKKICIDKNTLVKEHRNLISLLKKSRKADRLKEARDQQKELEDYEGAGVKDWLKNAYSVFTNPIKALTSIPNQVKEILEKYGSNTVNKITVYREPIKAVVNKALNVISSGDFNKNMINKGYDVMFHLYCVMSLDNGVDIYTERNERVKMVIWDRKPINAESRFVRTNIRLQSIFNSALENEGAGLWRYDPITNNCQKYITALLKYNHYLTPELNAFINQDASNLLTKEQHEFSKGLTDIVSLGRNIFNGGNYNTF